MSTETSPQKAKWPTVICVLSVIYTLLYAALYVRPPRPGADMVPSLGNWIICLLFLSGSIGLGLRRRWAVSLLLIGSIFALVMVTVSFFSIIAAMGGVPDLFVLLGILTFMFPTLAWPVFLIIWFSRSSTKRMIQEQWI